MDAGAFDSTLRQAGRTLARFPLVLAASLAGMVAALRHNHLPIQAAEGREAALHAMLALWLAVPFLLALALFAEGRRLGRAAAWGLQAGGVLLVAAWWRTLADQTFPALSVRFWLLMTAAHLLVGLAPALGRDATEASFWQFNLRLLARAGQSLLHAALLVLGASVALAAIQALFEMPFPDQVFLDPVLVVLGAFYTGFLLAGLPRPGPADPDWEYPRQLRLSARFILMPFVAAYLVILYAYGLKVLVDWRWPDSRAVWMVIAFCVLGLATLFLIQPLEEPLPAGPPRPPGAGGADKAAEPRGAGGGGGRLARVLGTLSRRAAALGTGLGGVLPRLESNGYRVFGTYFYPALVPLQVLLLAAIGKRVHQYGLTENRYLVLAFAVWLCGITFHYLIDRRRDIRILPASLCLISLLAAFGPWDAFEVSRKSQLQRLQTLLEGHGMLVGGKLAKAAGPVSREDKREIAGVAEFLEERRRLGDLTPWLPSLDDSVRTHPVVWLGALDNKFAFLQALELPYVPPNQGTGGPAGGIAFLCRACEAPLKRVTGYDLLFVDFRSDAVVAEEGRDLPGPESDGLPALRFAFEPDSGLLRFTSRDSALLALDLDGYFQGLRERYPDAYDLNLPEEEMVLETDAERLKVRLRLRSLRADAGEPARLKSFAADVFVQVKTPGVRRR